MSKVIKILQDNLGLIDAAAAFVSDKAKLTAFQLQANKSAYTSFVFHVAFLIDAGAFNNVANNKYEAILNEADIATQSKSDAGGPLPWFERQRACARNGKIKKLVIECTSLDAIREALTEKGLTTMGKVKAYTKKDPAKLSNEQQAIADNMTALMKAGDLFDGLDQDQIDAVQRSNENTIRTTIKTVANNAEAAKKASVLAKMKNGKKANAA